MRNAGYWRTFVVDKGFYKDAGLDVTITRAVYDTNPATGPLLQPILDTATKYFGNPKLTGADLIWTA